MLFVDPFDHDVVRAICTDCAEREFAREFGPTTAQKKQNVSIFERHLVSDAFESGDHQPDGTVTGVHRVDGKHCLNEQSLAALLLDAGLTLPGKLAPWPWPDAKF